MVYEFLADGFEIVEAMFPVDLMRRAGIEVQTVGVTGPRVTSSAKVTVEADVDGRDFVLPEDAELVVLPGGMPGTTNLRRDQRVCDLVSEFASTKHVAAICAAPSILGELGLLIGRKATCFPGFESSFPAGTFAGPKTVVVDGNIITASAMGQALPFALAVLEDIAGKKAVEKVREGIQL